MRLTQDLSKKEWLNDKEKPFKQSNNLGLKISTYENSEIQQMLIEIRRSNNFEHNFSLNECLLIKDLELLSVIELN